MKKLINNSIIGVIALFLIFGISTKSTAQSVILAEEFAHNASVKLMNYYCPMSGSNASASVSQVEYDFSNSRYIMKACIMCDYGTFQVDGILKVNSNGSGVDFRPTFKNSFVTDKEFYSKLTGGAILLGAMLAASSASSSN
jgi:hypothetical protein